MAGGKDQPDVDPWDATPIYMQIANILAAKIEAGEYGPGDQLPSELVISQRYGVARGTARAVHAELRKRGLAVTLPVRGSFVPPQD